ncbi:MAG: nitroreductase family protein [Bacillota bacterium]
MELEDAVRGRRSVRKFSSRPVPEDLIKKIIETALWAPSNKNKQP